MKNKLDQMMDNRLGTERRQGVGGGVENLEPGTAEQWAQPLDTTFLTVPAQKEKPEGK